MPRITYLAPEYHASGRKLVEKTGIVIWLTIGDRRVKCVLQDPQEYPQLVHYASGWIMGRDGINRTKVKALAMFGHNHHLTNREAARAHMEAVVAAKGADAVLAMMDAQEVINK